MDWLKLLQGLPLDSLGDVALAVVTALTCGVFGLQITIKFRRGRKPKITVEPEDPDLSKRHQHDD